MPNSVTEQFKLSMPSTVCRHLSRVLQCHVYYLNKDSSIRCSFAYGQPASQSDDSDLICALFSDEKIEGRPVIKTARPGEMYIGVDLFENDKFFGRLAAGPITGTAYDNIKAEKADDYYNNAVSTAVLLYNLVYCQWIDDSKLLEELKQERSSRKKSASTAYSKQPEPLHHHSIVYENQFFSLITEGDEKKLLQMIKNPPDGEYGLLDKQHPLRSIKNDCICIITLAARAAIAGGLDSETAFSISDEAIQNVELHRDLDKLYTLIEQTLCKFANLVADTKQLNYSYRINRCTNYVTNHIYEKMTVSSIAKFFNISPEYLSEQFKKETGTRLIDFIQTSRANEAKKLLLYTDKPILEIASLLNYHDQSHFTKSFKSLYGITPREFREQFRST